MSGKTWSTPPNLFIPLQKELNEVMNARIDAALLKGYVEVCHGVKFVDDDTAAWARERNNARRWLKAYDAE